LAASIQQHRRTWECNYVIDGDHYLALGGVRLALVQQRPLAQLSGALFVPGNLRGVMAAGIAGEVRVRAGREVEVELLSQRPMSLGRAYATGAGKLSEACVTAIIHGIMHAAPGEPSNSRHAEQALRSGLLVVEEMDIRSLTLPSIEIVSTARRREDQGRAMGSLIAGHLRRRSRIRTVRIASLDPDFLAGTRNELLSFGAIPIDEFDGNR
jgi:O-acetyl-ADP-ribose deacetylase (regulator of RNase III)